MNCPKCGCVRTQVVIKRDCLTPPFSVVRRRVCKDCGHRWYAAQPPEQIVRFVNYANNGKVVESVCP
jgi:transcriptional regulator NrdR family protein